jgi:hypothetical protein
MKVFTREIKLSLITFPAGFHGIVNTRIVALYSISTNLINIKSPELPQTHLCFPPPHSRTSARSSNRLSQRTSLNVHTTKVEILSAPFLARDREFKNTKMLVFTIRRGRDANSRHGESQ